MARGQACVWCGAALLLAALAVGCAGSHAGVSASAATLRVATVTRGRVTRTVRIGGTTVATHAFTLRIPQVPGQSYQHVLIGIVPNGTKVTKG